MTIVLSDRAANAIADAPAAVRKAVYKQLRFLAGNLNHPSLHAKKYDEAKDILAGEGEQRLAVLFQDRRQHLLRNGCHTASEVAKRPLGWDDNLIYRPCRRSRSSKPFRETTQASLA